MKWKSGTQANGSDSRTFLLFTPFVKNEQPDLQGHPLHTLRHWFSTMTVLEMYHYHTHFIGEERIHSKAQSYGKINRDLMPECWSDPS
jgi:hypothetical protein